MAAAKYLRNHPSFPGTPQETAATDVSAGPASAGNLVALNSNGVVDQTSLPSVVANALSWALNG